MDTTPYISAMVENVARYGLRANDLPVVTPFVLLRATTSTQALDLAASHLFG